MSRQYFGTDGIRGVAGQYPMNAMFAYELGAATAQWLVQQTASPLVVLGRDTRRSGPMLEAAVTAGLTSRGAQVITLGVMPTPGVSFACQALQAHAGMVISASHNPFVDNGIKLFGAGGDKLADESELEIERLLPSVSTLMPLTGADIGDVSAHDDLHQTYIDFLKSHSPDLTGLRVALDCAHGASYRLAPELFRQLGAHVTTLAAEPDGLNINKACGSTHPEALQTHMKTGACDIGITFDGDADRVLLVDRQGRVATGDHMLAMIALARRETAVVSTVMGNMGAELYLLERGIEVHRASVGDRYVKAMLQDKGLTLGGEQSGHMLVLDKAPTGDGMLTALLVLEALALASGGLAHWLDDIPIFPQVLRNVSVPTEKKQQLTSLPAVKEAIAEAHTKLASEGRVNVRPSGTEPLVRVMVEGREQTKIEAVAEALVQVVARVASD